MDKKHGKKQERDRDRLTPEALRNALEALRPVPTKSQMRTGAQRPHGHARGHVAVLSSAIGHIGALLGDIGILMQQRAPGGGEREAEEKYRAAKAALREWLDELRGAIALDNAEIPREFRLVLGWSLSEAIGALRACSDEGLLQARGTLENLFRMYQDLRRVIGDRAWGDPLAGAARVAELIQLKRSYNSLLEDGVPADRLRFERDGDEVLFAGSPEWGTSGPWPVHPERHEDADAIIEELNDAFAICDYPGLELTRRFHDLANPPAE